MSEQQPQHEPWIQPPAAGARGAQPADPGQPAGQGVQPDAGPAQPVPVDVTPAQPEPVDVTPAQPEPVDVTPAQPTPAQPVAGPQPVPGPQPYPGQSSYGQPYAWQQHPYAGQPYPAPQQPYAGMPYYPLPQQPVASVAIDPRRRHVHRVTIGTGVAAVLAATLAVGVAFGVGPTRETSAVSGGSSSSSGQVAGGSSGSGGSSSTTPGGSAGSGGSSSTNPNAVPNFGGDGSGSGSGSGSSSSSGSATVAGAVAATAAQQTGVVTITSQLQYQRATSAGTGMILSADGLVLTNNHVIDGATAIQVTVESTGKQYTATVVGTDPSADVALLQLKAASGLTPVTLDKSGVTTGTAITAIGNAEGTGSLVAAAGSVTNINQTMTAQTEIGGSSETLSGLIEFQASVVSGDSGGPVLDAQGEVVGMTTAASNGMGATDAFAISINSALTVVHEIQAGDTANGTITLGYPAFLGVALATPRTDATAGSGSSAGTGTTNGATISGVITGTPAASAGLVAGDTITAVDGKAVASSDALSTAMSGHKAGDRVTITWTSASTGASHTATVTLIAGPAN
jgi:S1-C subfamily serine protease